MVTDIELIRCESPNHYCIGRSIENWTEFWTPHGWKPFAYVFKDRALAKAVLELIRNYD